MAGPTVFTMRVRKQSRLNADLQLAAFLEYLLRSVLFYVYECVVCVPYVCLVPMEVRRHQMP